MKKRRSVRTYLKKAITKSDLSKAEKIIADTANPFGATLRFCLVHSETSEGRLGTYGMMRGAKSFVVGCAKPGDNNIEGFGYAFENAILGFTAMGIGTCWMGGTFKRGAFASAAKLDGEIIVAVTPIGYINEKRTVLERIVASGAGARKRIDFGELFFERDFGTSLDLQQGDLRTCLEMVRIGPSASNKQPWRVVKVGDNLHFYLAKTPGYAGNIAYGFAMQRIDMGIAACHFERAAKELGLAGGIKINDPKIPTEYDYSFSWEG